MTGYCQQLDAQSFSRYISLMVKNKNKSILARLLFFMAAEKKRLAIGAAVAILIAASHLVRPLILRQIIDSAIPAHDIPQAIKLALFFVGALCAGAAIQYFQVINLAKLGLNIVTELKNRVFKHILKQDISFFDHNQPGQLMARTESDIERLKVIFSHSAMVILQSSLMLIGIITIIVLEVPVFGLLVAILLPIISVIMYFYLRFIMKIWTIVRKKNSFLTGYITEYIQAVPLIQLFTKKAKAIELLLKHSHEKMGYEKRGLFYDYVVFWSFFHFFTETIALVVVFYYGIGQILQGQMTLGSLIMYTELMRQLFMPLRNLMMVLSEVQSSLAAGSRVFAILDAETKVHNEGDIDSVPKLENAISFRRIKFGYDKEPVIKNISFDIKAGENVAIIGPSGSGKTTIINLLLRFYDLTEGDILIDGTNIEDFRLDKLRQDIGLVLQDVYLFPGTIMDNLKAFNPDVPDETVIEAAKKLGAHQLILKQPGGYNCQLAETGSNLSMGERQLISFTRALVKDPHILILDEATSSVDVITENLLQKALKKLMEGRTAIIIAHRLSTIREAHRIIVLDEGEIAESGTHEQLLSQNGLYKKLHDIQQVIGA